MDFDLNQEPIDPHPSTDTSFEFLLLDRAQELVEDRIRHLEDRERRGKGKALEINPNSKNTENETGRFYHCNICFDVAIEPVLTCCGHLFCWACFYQVSDIDLLNSKECPVCKGEVSKNALTPIYGSYAGEPVRETESGLKIPPRPKACRVEGIRQQIAAYAPNNIPVEELFRHIMTSMVDGVLIDGAQAEPRRASGRRTSRRSIMSSTSRNNSDVDGRENRESRRRRLN